MYYCKTFLSCLAFSLISCSLIAAAPIKGSSSKTTKQKNNKETPVAAEDHYKWTGFYGGLNAGVLWNLSRGQVKPSGDYLTYPGKDNNHLRTDAIHFHGAGFTGGLQLGYNYQFFKRIVIGLETDFQYSSLKKTNHVDRILASPLHDSFIHTVSDKFDWFGTFRPRIGFAVIYPLLLYATGGLSYGHIKSDSNISFTYSGDTYTGSLSKVCIGWNVGGGLEWGFLKDWSMKLEYLFLQLKEQSYVDPVMEDLYPGYSYATDILEKSNIIRLGFNYRF
jgi:outer membrane immunogenic protein